jgi:nicotinate-nucleotide adenylyltransferase
MQAFEAAGNYQEQTTSMTRIGIFGGTFDPVHYGHLAIAEEVYHKLKLARVVFVPAGQPPHKLGWPITPAQQRLEMLQLAVADNPHFEISLVDIQRVGPSYTVDTLRLLREEWGPHVELYFIIGGDSLKDLPSWHDPAGVIAQACIVALMRPGYVEIEALGQQLSRRLPGLAQRLLTLTGPRMDISSTDLRQRVRVGEPVRYQIPDAVERYMREQHLYDLATVTANAQPMSPGKIQEDTNATNAI